MKIAVINQSTNHLTVIPVPSHISSTDSEEIESFLDDSGFNNSECVYGIIETMTITSNV